MPRLLPWETHVGAERARLLELLLMMTESDHAGTLLTLLTLLTRLASETLWLHHGALIRPGSLVRELHSLLPQRRLLHLRVGWLHLLRRTELTLRRLWTRVLLLWPREALHRLPWLASLLLLMLLLMLLELLRLPLLLLKHLRAYLLLGLDRTTHISEATDRKDIASQLRFLARHTSTTVQMLSHPPLPCLWVAVLLLCWFSRFKFSLISPSARCVTTEENMLIYTCPHVRLVRKIRFNMYQP